MGILVQFTATVGEHLILGGGVVPEEMVTPLYLADMPKFQKEISKEISDIFDKNVGFGRIMIFSMERNPAHSTQLIAIPAPKTDLLDQLLVSRKKEAN